MNKETSEKLIKYLIKHAHWSSRNGKCLFRNKTTRDIAHSKLYGTQFISQEFSPRYADPKEMGDMFEYVKQDYKMQKQTELLK